MLKQIIELRAWSSSEITLQDGPTWKFDVKKPSEGLILAGSECGPIDTTVFVGEDHYIKAKLIRKAEKLRGYLETLVSVIERAARAYHVERLAFRVLKYTARSRAQYFLRVFSPELTEEASLIVDEAIKAAEIKLLGWTNEETDQGSVRASLPWL